MASIAPHRLPPDPVPPPGWETLESFAFGDSAELADKLLALVLDGTKRATCWDVRDGQQTEVGKRMVVRDGAGRPRAVIETVELVRRRFNDIDAEFARDEGEGDLTLDDWREGHRRYFERHGHFALDMWLWCERFRLVARL